jgi:hypothetical protein
MYSPSIRMSRGRLHSVKVKGNAADLTSQDSKGDETTT